MILHLIVVAISNVHKPLWAAIYFDIGFVSFCFVHQNRQTKVNSCFDSVGQSQCHINCFWAILSAYLRFIISIMQRFCVTSFVRNGTGHIPLVHLTSAPRNTTNMQMPSDECDVHIYFYLYLLNWGKLLLWLWNVHHSQMNIFLCLHANAFEKVLQLFQW